MIAILSAAPSFSAAESAAFDAKLTKAKEMHQRGDYAHSIPILIQLVRVSPRNFSANLMLGQDLYRSGRPKDALGPLRVAAESRPDDLTAIDYSVAASEALGDFASEAEALEIALARSHQNEQYLLAWGNFCIDRFKTIESAMMTTRQGEAVELRFAAWGVPEGSQDRESLLERSAALAPDQPGIWGELGISQFLLGKRAQAQATLVLAEQRQPHAAETLQLAALLAASVQNWQGAEKLLRSLGVQSQADLTKAIEAWPPGMIPGREVNGAVWNCLRNSVAPCNIDSSAAESSAPADAKALFAGGRWEELVALPESSTASRMELVWRGVALARTGDCSKAIPTLERGLTASEREGALYLQNCYANEEFRAENRLKADGKAGAYHELKGDLELTIRNDPAAAESDYAEALKFRPQDARLLARSAEAIRLNGDQTRARTAALAALAIDAHQTQALQTLAEIALYQRNYPQAVVWLAKIVALQPRNSWSKAELGVAYEKLGQAGEAVRYLEPLLAAGYPDPKGELHGQLAVAFGKLGRKREAQRAAAEASRLSNRSLESGENAGTDLP